MSINGSGDGGGGHYHYYPRDLGTASCLASPTHFISFFCFFFFLVNNPFHALTMKSRSTSTSTAATVNHHEGKKNKLFILSPEVSSYFIAGGVAGATSRTFVSPLERLKIIQ